MPFHDLDTDLETFLATTDDCPHCDGTGKITVNDTLDLCMDCGGTGIADGGDDDEL